MTGPRPHHDDIPVQCWCGAEIVHQSRESWDLGEIAYCSARCRQVPALSMEGVVTPRR